MELSVLRDVRSVLFDVYGTLVRISNPSRPYRQLLGLARGQGASIDDDVASILMSQRMTLQQAARWLGVALSAEQMKGLEQDLAAELGSVQMFPEVPAVLTALRERGYRLGVCSNLAVPYVAPAWRLLEPYIDIAIWSCEVGLVKPDPEIYRLAALRLDAPVERIMMVGDTHRTDVAGPQAAGLHGQLLSRHRIRVEGVWSTLEALL